MAASFMQKTSNITIQEFGGRVASVWEGLRPSTRSLVERALTSAAPVSICNRSSRVVSASYDARSEWELSRLLSALDGRAKEAGAPALSTEEERELTRMAETCAHVLHGEARSAEVFAQLLERALGVRDYARVDVLADTLTARLASSEICELARHPNPSVRALAHEALAQSPTGVLVELLGDPVDSDVARDALELQADDYGSEEARWVVSALERADASEEDEA
ncbi:MAG TPA: hypothetical protein VER76_21950 [Pyrinomonadaceae bacterium]|nr:hypothetical protein [Pyrinomonadaceae bacterium]